MRKKTRPDPLVSDPLAETSVQRRIWAAYLRGGYTRWSFARALGVSYSTVDAWDTGASMPSVDLLRSASELLGVPINQLFYGHRGAPGGDGREAELSRESLKALLNEIGATPEQRAALGEHEQSPAGRYQDWTRSYVIMFADAYKAARRGGATHDQSMDEALSQAINARAVAEVVTAGQPTIARDDLRDILRTKTTPPPPLASTDAVVAAAAAAKKKKKKPGSSKRKR
jgi:transcriptional regulator with XRE-family HTH domain